MALLKKIQTGYGVEASYWKIVQLNINWFDRNAHIELCGWKDKEARDNRCLYLDSRSFDFYKEEFDFVPDENLVEKSYNKIKAYKIKEVGEDGKEIERDGEFSDAKDC